MPVFRHFLGWDRPLVDAVRDFIIPTPPKGPVDLSSTLILVPTRHAARRLTDSLALACAKADAALLSCQIMTPTALFQSSATPNVAGPLDVEACWIQTLSSIDTSTLTGLFPSPPPESDVEWALRLASMIETLRHTLLDAGLTIRTLLDTQADTLVERERWQDLARLETAYLERLTALGLKDPCEHLLAVTDQPELDAALTRIVVAAVPDPNEPARRILERLTQTVQVDILIAAPKNLADTFDAWGRPLPEAWTRRPIEIPEPDERIVLAADPTDQAVMAVDLLQTHATKSCPAAIGAPDRSLVPHLQAAIRQRGGTAFDPADKPLREHPLAHLVSAWLNLATSRSTTALATLLRQPDLLAHLDHRTRRRGAALLSQLDTFQNERLPWDLAAISHWLSADSAPQPLADTLAWMTEMLPNGTDSLAERLRAFLQTILEHRTLTAGQPEDDEFERAARAIDESIHELAEMESRTHLPLRSAVALFLRRLSNAHYHRECESDAIDLDGWLELAWNPAPILIIAGMNEGAVPSSPAPDPFLPDSLRSTLGIRSDADMFARDAFLLQSILATRQNTGQTWLISGKVSDSGDPLRPSRLLLRCPDEQLTQRARQLFRNVAPTLYRPATTVNFQLDPAHATEAEPPATLSVTAFRDYLACPFRFYLKHVLRMEVLDDSKRAPDALDFGILVHSALQRMGEHQDLRCSTDARALSEFLTTQAERWIERQYGAAPALPIRIALHAARQRLEAAAEVQATLAAEGWEIIAVEQAFEHDIGGLIVKGKIDRIDQHRDTGALRVIDYKTTDTASEPLKAHLAAARPDPPEFATLTIAGKPKRWTDLQLPLYTVLGIATTDQPPEPAYFNLPRAISETALSPWPDFNRDIAEAALASATAIATQVRQGIFWPPADYVTYDDFESLFHDGMAGWKEVGAIS